MKRVDLWSLERGLWRNDGDRMRFGGYEISDAWLRVRLGVRDG